MHLNYFTFVNILRWNKRSDNIINKCLIYFLWSATLKKIYNISSITFFCDFFFFGWIFLSSFFCDCVILFVRFIDLYNKIYRIHNITPLFSLKWLFYMKILVHSCLFFASLSLYASFSIIRIWKSHGEEQVRPKLEKKGAESPRVMNHDWLPVSSFHFSIIRAIRIITSK